MKKILLLLGFILAGVGVFAQVQRKAAETHNKNNAVPGNEMETKTDLSEKENELKVLKELNLTREQKGKLKEMRQVNQSKKETIVNDPTLTEAQKKEKLKEIKRSIAFELKNILTDKQIEKMKAIHAVRNGYTSENAPIK